jgi:hypothetical protein
MSLFILYHNLNDTTMCCVVTWTPICHTMFLYFMVNLIRGIQDMITFLWSRIINFCLKNLSSEEYLNLLKKEERTVTQQNSIKVNVVLDLYVVTECYQKRKYGIFCMTYYSLQLGDMYLTLIKDYICWLDWLFKNLCYSPYLYFL